MVPIRAWHWEEWNERLVEQCENAEHAGCAGTKRRLENVCAGPGGVLPLPGSAYEACEKQSARVSSLSLVRYRTNDYSAPTEYGYRDVLVKGYVHEVLWSAAVR